jgi:hypothetical protein
MIRKERIEKIKMEKERKDVKKEKNKKMIMRKGEKLKIWS